MKLSEYVECLDEVLVERMDGLYGMGKWRFVQDGAKPHTAINTKDYLEYMNIKTLKHPPYSPDLNPIEKVWAYLKPVVMDRAYDNLDELLQRITEEWNRIPQEMINNLIDGHCKRVREVYALKGAFK